MRIVNMGKQAASTRRNNIGIQAKQPIIEQPPFNVRREMLEVENAVEAVRNLEQRPSLSNTLEQYPVHVVNTSKRAAANQSMPLSIKEEESDVAALAAPSESSQPKRRGPKLAPKISESDNTCPQLYDPCTKEPISNLEELEKRVRELKKQQNTVPVGLYGLTNNTSIYDFIMDVFLNPSISLDDMVSFKLGKGRQVGSDIFEVLSRIFVLLGGIENVDTRTGGNYKFMKKIESIAPEVYDNTIDALRTMKCIASKESGMSDITLVYTGNKTQKVDLTLPYCEGSCTVIDPVITKTYVMSVKWYKKEKSAEHYDLEKLFAAAHRLIDSSDRHPVDIIVFLKSKREFEYAHSRAARQYTNKLARTYFGWNEDMKPFFERKRHELFSSALTLNKSIPEAFTVQYDKHNSKPVLTLQLHQDIIVKGICDQIEQNDDNLYLIGVLPRGGKTFIAGGIIREYMKRLSTQNINIFWLTAAPTETRSQVGKELIEQYQDFDSFDFIDVTSTAELRKTRPDSIFFCSSQLLTGGKKGDKQVEQKRKYLDTLIKSPDQLGLFFFDEAHKTGTGDETKDKIQAIIDMYQGNNLPFIFLTATYYNILIDYEIQKNNTFIWDYTDVLATRSLGTELEREDSLANLRQRFDEDLVNSIIEKRIKAGDTYEMMAKAYIGFPDLYFISADFQKEALERFEIQKSYSPDAGFSLDAIFSIKLPKRILEDKEKRQTVIDGITVYDVLTRDGSVRQDAYNIFTNITHPKNMISLITPYGQFNDTMIHTNGGEPFIKEKGSLIEPSILGRIDKISSKANNRFRLDKQPTILMFMPTGGEGTNIFYLLCAWASLLLTYSWWRDNYEIACVVDGETIPKSNDDEKKDDNSSIHIINKNPKAEIIERERKLHCRDNPKGLVILAGEKLSMGVSLPCTDVVFLFNTKKTPDDIIQKMYRALTPSPGKKISFVVDLNPIRTLAAVYGYTRASHQTLNTSTELLDVVYDTYSWDTDMFDMNLNKGVDAKPLTFQDKLREMYEKASKDADYRIHDDMGGIEKKMKKNIIKGLTEQSKGRLADHFSSKKMESAIGSLRLKHGAKVTLSKGKLIVRRPKPSVSNSESNNESNSESNDPESNAEIVIDNFIETVIDFVKYLAITSTKNTLYEAIEEYESNQGNDLNSNGKKITLKSNVLSMVRSRVEITGSDNELLSTILVEAVKDFAQNSSEEIFREMKGKIDEKSIRKDKILAIINKRLTPRHKQKKEAGEVFTPIELIEKMMDHLPKSVWKNPDMKWIDPANGIGNFPVVIFYKLDEGLKTLGNDKTLGVDFSNDKQRRKYIIENMIYMIELQSNNNRVARRIFETLCEGCKPNILTANTVELTAEKLKAKGFPEKYDIVMGNPPFQLGAYRSFYLKFINFAHDCIKENGYLVYVIPNKILIPNDVNKAIKKFNPLFIYHTVNKEYFPTISTTICGVVAKNEPFKKETKVIFSNGEKIVNLDEPTPTQYDDIYLKEVSDKIFFGKNRKYLETLKLKPEEKHIYLHSVWTRYSPDKPSGGTHVFDIIDPPSVRAEGKYIEIPSGMDKSLFTWYLSRSEAMRFITKIYAGAMNVPAFIWGIIPSIPLKSETDAEVYKLLGLNNSDIKIIKESLNDNIQADDESVKGGKRFAKTRKRKN